MEKPRPRLPADAPAATRRRARAAGALVRTGAWWPPLLLGSACRESVDVREALVETLDEVPALQAVDLVLSLVLASIAWQLTDQAWPAMWLAVEGFCLPIRGLGRWRLSSFGRRSAVAAHALRLLVSGVCAMQALWLGHLMLGTSMCMLVTMQLAIVASRWAGLPRLAGALVLAVGGCLWAGFIGSPVPGMVLASGLVPLVAGGMAMLAFHNHRLMLHLMHLQVDTRRRSPVDALTGLPNRRALGAWLRQLEQGGRSADGQVALLCLDLDGLRAVNDALGHEAGDELLAESARRLRDVLRTDDAICRLDGGAFVVLLPGADEPVAAHVAQRLLQSIARPFAFEDGRQARVGLSVGIALRPGHADEPERLFKRADEALREAKRAGKGCYRWATQG